VDFLNIVQKFGE